MKKIIFLFLCCFITNSIFSQKNEDLVLFGKGNALYEMVHYELFIDNKLINLDTSNIEEKIKYHLLKEQKGVMLEKALEYFEELIEDFPESDLLYRTVNHAALIAHQLNYEEKAIEYYKTIMTTKDNKKSDVEDVFMAGSSFYKNSACKSLAEIYIKKGKYTEAIKYIDLVKKYPYQTFCGNDYAADDIYMATLYTQSYMGLKDVKNALKYALPHIFFNGLAENNEIVELTVQLLKEHYDIKQIEAEFSAACKAYFSEQKKHKKQEWTTYYISFLDTKIPLSFYELDVYELDSSGDLNEIMKEHFKNSYFTELIKQ